MDSHVSETVHQLLKARFCYCFQIVFSFEFYCFRSYIQVLDPLELIFCTCCQVMIQLKNSHAPWTIHQLLFLPFFFFLFRASPMEVPRLGVKQELQLLAYTTAKATLNPSCICDLCRSLWQHRILNPLSEARDQT